MNDTEEDDLAGVQMFFITNPKSANDPFSKRWDKPGTWMTATRWVLCGQAALIVMMNYDDNPWYGLNGI